MKEYRTSIVSFNPTEEGEALRQQESSAFRLTNILLEYVTRKKERTLFTEQEEAELNRQIEEGLQLTEKKDIVPVGKGAIYFTDENKKSVIPSVKQMKAILIFAEVVDNVRNGGNEVIDEYVRTLPDRIQWGEGKRGGSMAPLRGTVYINEFARELTGTMSGNLNSKQIADAEEVLKSLQSLRITQDIKLSDGGTLTVSDPVLILGKTYTRKNKKDVVINSAYDIERFGDVFFYGLDLFGGYQIAPRTLLQRWNTVKEDSGLFGTTLFLLIRLFGTYVKHACDTADKKRKELNSKKLPPEEIKKEVESVFREALTYREGVPSLLDRVDNKLTFYKVVKGNKYLRKDKIQSYLDKTKEGLLKVGIVSEVYFTQGGMMCNFVFNPQWRVEEKKRLK